jgi:hypothetical protein
MEEEQKINELIEKINKIEKEYKHKMDDLLFDYKKKIQEIVDQEKINHLQNSLNNK